MKTGFYTILTQKTEVLEKTWVIKRKNIVWNFEAIFLQKFKRYSSIGSSILDVCIGRRWIIYKTFLRNREKWFFDRAQTIEMNKNIRAFATNLNCSEACLHSCWNVMFSFWNWSPLPLSILMFPLPTVKFSNFTSWTTLYSDQQRLTELTMNICNAGMNCKMCLVLFFLFHSWQCYFELSSAYKTIEDIYCTLTYILSWLKK